MATQTFTSTLVVVTCGKENCDLVFGMPEHLYERRRRDHQTWYCPNGHPRCFTSKSALEVARENRDYWQATAADRYRELEMEKRRSAAARGQVTRIKRRVGKGVCPCCNRTFQDLARHMAGQHPTWSEEG